jgi:hypothetical protein
MAQEVVAAEASGPHCLICGTHLGSNSTLDFGSLSACNDYSREPSTPPATHPLAMAQCAACGLVQLTVFPPASFVRPKVPWIRYNEPVAHLATLAGRLRHSFSQPAPSVLGVVPFDSPLLDCLAAQGFHCRSLGLAAHLPRQAGCYPYLETMQELLRPATLGALATGFGAVDLVCCRYLLEHSHDPVASLQALGQLVDASGTLLVEVPDSTKFLASLDYSFVWEEHVCYFTESTLQACARRAGYNHAQVWRYPGLLEDALVLVLRTAKDTPILAHGVGDPPDLFARYRASLADQRDKYARALARITGAGGKVAIFGAGHQSVMFLQALGLQEHIAVVIDDDPDKRGCRMPGTDIEIVGSEYLQADPAIRVCLLGVSPAAEAKIRANCAGFLRRGGMMVSIFPAAGRGTLVDPAL